MKSISKVLWTKEASENLSKVIKYLEENWTEKEIKKFLTKLDKHISLIRTQPDSFPKANNYNVRRSVLTKQITLYYSISQETLFIVSIFDNRQNPKKLKI
jgi:plasmid stabilization system protein ParE